MAALWPAWTGAASATVITPTTTSDDPTTNGTCTLREAMQAADTDSAVNKCLAGSGPDVIKLRPGNYALSLTGQGEDR